MVQLADRVQQVERLKDKKAKVNKIKKELVAYVDMEDSEVASDAKYNHVEGNKVNLVD